MVRNLVLVLGDQLDAESAAFDGFDAAHDATLQIEAREEASYVPQHKMRLVLFFSAMRHFRALLRAKGFSTHYSRLDDPENLGTFADEARRWFGKLQPERLVVLAPGDFRVQAALSALQLPIEMRADRHFLCSRVDFAAFADEHPNMVLETFYRRMRSTTGALMDGDAPRGGAWNFDKDNRKPFPRTGGPHIPKPSGFAPDATTRAVMQLVEKEFSNAPGRLDNFCLPVTRENALEALADFCSHRLQNFGPYQDAMVGGAPFLFHSLLSAPLNLHLLNPREVLDVALKSEAPLASLEGFVRQIIGWREFVHGLYWRLMPDYAEHNALDAQLPMPRFYWTVETDMRCLAEAIAHTIDYAYAHHIERLMVLGQFALLLGVKPYDVHRWHLSMFRDAIDWVSLPNTLGMSQHADGGVIGTKPYVASGNYISRMSDHCRKCRYDPHKADGDDACPFTTLYYDFLARHQPRFARNGRMKQQYLNFARKDSGEVLAIRRRAERLKAELTAQTFL